MEGTEFTQLLVPQVDNACIFVSYRQESKIHPGFNGDAGCSLFSLSAISLLSTTSLHQVSFIWPLFYDIDAYLTKRESERERKRLRDQERSREREMQYCWVHMLVWHFRIFFSNRYLHVCYWFRKHHLYRHDD